MQLWSQMSRNRRLVVAGICLAIIGIAAVGWAPAWTAWLGLTRPAPALLVSGNIEAHESVLGFKTVQSRIVELPFNEGASVKTGTVVARVDDSDYRKQVDIAQATLEVQERQLASTEQNVEALKKTVMSDRADVAFKKSDAARYDTLWKAGWVSTQQHDSSETAYKQAAAVLERDEALELGAERNVALAQANIHNALQSLDLARIVLGYTTLQAPFDGVILVRQAELGEVTQPGSPVITLADLDHVWLRAYINETDISRIRLGAKVAVTTDTFPGKLYDGRISFISESAEFTPKSVETHAERVTLVYRIKIDIDNPTHELVPGMPADGRIQLSGP
ncbi:MAG TPA: efflux RND transporter periplasmic adaptor subunit [Stellaceae bacterium]|nr:efflux RND transporter periplasmic adaptor subunit [Stellaceae bacterium]